MFIQYAGRNDLNQPINTGVAEQLFRFHPEQIHLLLEDRWANRDRALEPFASMDAAAHPDAALWAADPDVPAPAYVWPHLIYAFMIESTMIFEVFSKVLHEFRTGERLGHPTAASERWLRNTEDLFYHDIPPRTIYSLDSHIRPALSATRENAYFRMFGRGIDHPNGHKVEFVKPKDSNTRFIEVFEELLAKVWEAISNVQNTSGVNPTNPADIGDLVAQIHDQLLSRRQNGALGREEFFFVSMMSWFHLTLAFNSPVVADLQADSESFGERLKLVGQRVGVATHAKAQQFTNLAEPMSLLLREIEAGNYGDAASSPLLYDGSLVGHRQDVMRTIILNWSAVTGRDVRAMKTRQAVH